MTSGDHWSLGDRGSFERRFSRTDSVSVLPAILRASWDSGLTEGVWGVFLLSVNFFLPFPFSP